MKKAFLITASFFVIHSLFSQTFTALNSGTGNQLNGMSFLSDTKGTIVGDGGKILMTTNGVNWVHRISGVITNLKDVEYINSSTIIVVGEGGTILKSTNGGLQWTSINSGVINALTSVFVNGSNVYACGFDGVILKSTDEGESWAEVDPSYGDHLFEICFLSPTIGYTVGLNASILRTTNGGNSWTTVNTGISTDFQLRGIFFKDINNGFIVGKSLVSNQSVILRTINGGLTWTSQIVYGVHYIDIEFLSNDVGFVLSQNLNSNTSLIYSTTDGGANWNFQSSIAYAQADMFFPSFNAGYTCGSNGSIFKTTNISLGIEDLESDPNLSIYPNPCKDQITISFDSSIYSENFIINIYSISGERLISKTNAGEIDVSQFPSGVYILKIQDGFNSWTKKIIKE